MKDNVVRLSLGEEREGDIELIEQFYRLREQGYDPFRMQSVDRVLWTPDGLLFRGTEDIRRGLECLESATRYAA